MLAPRRHSCPPARPYYPPLGGATTHKSWFSGLSLGQQALVGIGAALGVVGILSIIKRSGIYDAGESYAPNRGPLPAAQQPGTVKVRDKVWGRRSAPKKYRSRGATKPGDYAWPSDFMYPVRFRKPSGQMDAAETRKHIISAKGFFTKYKRRYPQRVRKTIAKNINAAVRWYNRERDGSQNPLKADVKP